MPWIDGCDKSGFAARYQKPIFVGIINDRIGGTQVLDIKRKEYATLVQDYKTLQKEFGQNKDLETAKFFKEAGREAQKNYYGICAALDYAGSNSGDCKDSLKNMTQEIAPYADHWICVADLLLEREQIRVMKEMGIY